MIGLWYIYRTTRLGHIVGGIEEDLLWRQLLAPDNPKVTWMS
jgi:hypothetical protein